MNTGLFQDFKWDFESEIEIIGKTLKIKAHTCSDYFVDSADGKRNLNAPYYHVETNKFLQLIGKRAMEI